MKQRHASLFQIARLVEQLNEHPSWPLHRFLWEGHSLAVRPRAFDGRKLELVLLLGPYRTIHISPENARKIKIDESLLPEIAALRQSLIEKQKLITTRMAEAEKRALQSPIVRDRFREFIADYLAKESDQDPKEAFFAWCMKTARDAISSFLAEVKDASQVQPLSQNIGVGLWPVFSARPAIYLSFGGYIGNLAELAVSEPQLKAATAYQVKLLLLLADRLSRIQRAIREGLPLPDRTKRLVAPAKPFPPNFWR